MRYSAERKEAVLKKMLPPNNRSIREIAEDEGRKPNPPGQCLRQLHLCHSFSSGATSRPGYEIRCMA